MSLVFLSGLEDCLDPLRIKVGSELGATLGFASRRVATHYADLWHIDSSVLSASELPEGVYGVGALLVFDSVEQIGAAYKDQVGYDFSQHLRQWPR